jgi:hypothetical protein
MDLSALAGAALPSLTAALPYLVQSGKDVAETVRKTLVEKVGKGVADVACKLWSRIAGSESAKKAAERVASDAENAKKQNALEVEIEDLLKADTTFAAELQKLLESAGTKVGGNVATASGAGAVAVGGNSSGNISTNVNTRSDKP